MPSKGKFRIWHLLEYIAQRNKEVNMRAIEGLRYGLKGLQNMPGGKNQGEQTMFRNSFGRDSFVVISRHIFSGPEFIPRSEQNK